MPFEILEHTADVGIRATAATIEETFQQATLGLTEILGAWREGNGDQRSISVSADDREGLLVDWLQEVLYLQESEDAVVCSVEVDRVTESEAQGAIVLAPRGDERLAGTAVKAITYHQLEVRRTDEGWEARVFVDV